MHKFTTTVLALGAGTALALGVPLAASATTAQAVPASIAQLNQNHPVDPSDQGQHKDQGEHNGHAYGHSKPGHTHPAYPPVKPTPPAHHDHDHDPFWQGGYWWFPFEFGPHTFHPGSVVRAQFNGLGFTFFGTFQSTASQSIVLGTAAADGSLTAQVKASGAKDLSGQIVNATVTDTAGTTVTQSVTVPAVAAASTTTTTSTGSTTAVKDASAQLPATGAYISIATVWGAVGLLALGAAFVVMQTVVRRKSRA
ncbi:MAG: hypothetical protein FWD85_03935 [Microbacteriaceae bacterium]|nr:hypothetical protein [Microbacteriaceae bacterium]MCL2794439.1 hypothetical protein [Microbacteriaceae bacterium]